MTETIEVVPQPNIPAYESIYLVGYAILVALVSEALSWYFIYRKPEYQRLKKSMKQTAKLLEKHRQEVIKERNKGTHSQPQTKKEKDKKGDRLTKELKALSAEMSKQQLLQTVLLGLITTGIYFSINKSFAGHVVAKLPFWPWKIVQNISHRGLPGDDITDCSMAFLFVIANMGIRASVTKLFGHEQPRILQEINQQNFYEQWAGDEEGDEKPKPAATAQVVKKGKGKKEKRR